MKRLCCAVLALLLFVPPLGAVDGRDFAGRYDVKSTGEGDQGVSVTLILDIQNVSGSAVSGVAFEIAGEGPAPVATVGPLDFPESASTRFSVQLTVSPTTYAQWVSGGARLSGSWTDNDGNLQKRVVELTRISVPDEVQQ